MALSTGMATEQLRGVLKYDLTTTDIDGEYDMRYTTYGIVAVNHIGDIVVCYKDVSTDAEFVKTIVDKCNELEVSAIHLEDILLDYIG